MRGRLWRHILVLSAIFVVALYSNAQDQASITGSVADSTGAVIPGSTVVLSDPSRGLSFKQTTDSLGLYRFMSVPTGTGYQITATREGFAVGRISDITLSIGLTRTQNITLTVGAESQTIAVSASNQNVTLNTTDATIGNNIDVQELNDLPVYDRSTGINSLFYQQPGVDSNQAAVTGARIDQSEVTVDGLDVNDLVTGQAFYLTTPAPVDSVAQFTGSVAGLTSSVGTGSGGQFQLVTKSGTNSFHGGFNEYHRDTSTVANTWFNNLVGLRRTPLIRNQFGADIGGPLKKDKLYFYFDWADSRIVQSSTAERIVPLADFRAGRFNYINSNAGCDDTSRINTMPSCITTLSSSQVQGLDPAGIGLSPNVLSYINSRYPAANDLSQGDGVNTGGFRFTYPTPDNRATYVGRIDYNLTPTQKIGGRFTITRRDATSSLADGSPDLPQFPSDPITHPYFDRSYSYVLNHTWNIGNNKVNQAYFGDNISKLSFPDTYNPMGANQPTFTGIDNPYTNYNGQKRRVPVPMVRDDFSWQIHKHTLAFGGTFKWIKTNSNLISNFNYPGIGLQGAGLSSGLDSSVRPNDIYDGPDQVAINDYDQLFATGLGVLGEIRTNYSYDNKGNALAAGAGTPRAYRFYQTEAYFGDTWRVTPKLSLSYGVRYQFYSVPYEVKGFESVPTAIPLDSFIKDRIAQQNSGDTSLTGLPLYSYKLGGKTNHGPDPYQPSYKDFAPRLAFSFSPFASNKTVINGGAGIIYDRTVINAINFLQDQISYLFFNQTSSEFGGNTVSESLATDPRVGSNLSYPANLNPAPQPLSVPYTPYVDSTGYMSGLAQAQTNFVISPNLKDPYSIALNFGVQQELPSHMILKMNYVGRLGRRLIATADANQVIDVPDYTHQSTQSMAQAFAGLTTELRAGKDYTQVTPQPWFENVLTPLFGQGNSTSAVAYYSGQYARRGDISDALYLLSAYGYYFFGTDFLPTNIGIPSQFGTNAYLTNKGNSNYHGMLVTLDKNMSNGLNFEANYTWSRSIDNTSVSANNNSLFTNSNMICDILNPRACRGDSDFDVRQELNGNFVYQLPFGRRKAYMSQAPRWADEAFGGWSISGLPSYRTGLALTAMSGAFLASFDNQVPAIFTGNKADLKTAVNVNHKSNTVWMFAGGSAGASKTLSEFRGPIGIEYGQRNNIRGPGAFFMDAGLGKQFPIVGDRLNLTFRADAFNVFNHPVFGGGLLNIVNNASQFGQITSALRSNSGNSARVAQFSLRLDY
jgi:hypothetical protein